MTKLKMMRSSACAHVSLTFEFRISYPRGQEHVMEQMLLSICIIPNEFSFMIEVIKALYYYISYYSFMSFETFVSKDFSFSWIDDCK